MRLKLLVVGTLLISGAGLTADLYACGAKFLVANRGTRFGRMAMARPPATVLVLANPSSVLAEALADVKVAEVLGRAGYRPTVVTSEAAFDQALAQGGWHLVLTDVAHGSALRGRLSGSGAPMVVPVMLKSSGAVVDQAKREYGHVIEGPIKSQRFLEMVDEAVADLVASSDSSSGPIA